MQPRPDVGPFDRRSLAGCRALLVEDEAVVAMMIESMLEQLGCRAIFVAQTMARALPLAQSAEADIAVLDVNVGGERVIPVAAILADRGVPFVFSTGYGRAGLEEPWRHYPVLAKPFALEDLQAALLQAMAGPGPLGVRG